jgi:segregation and condensation protein A
VAYDVSTEVFEGPFDLLLHLILSQQVELYEISLTTIVYAYLVEL